MKKAADVFQIISYIQYPLLFVAMFFVFRPVFTGFETYWANLNNALIFAGLAVSFSSLQDPTKTQNNFSKKIWEDPKKGKAGLVVLSIVAFSFMIFGLSGIFLTTQGILNEVSIGLFVLGIGYIGLLKVAIEMFDNHRLDRQGVEEDAADMAS